MPKPEKLRDALATPPSPKYFQQKAAEGWRLAGIEWVRAAAGERPDPDRWREEIPFGLQVSEDCLHLEENPTEKQALMLMMQLIVDDSPLSQVAQELNRRGYRTRLGAKWGPGAVFQMLPRLVEVGPKMFSSQEWVLLRSRIVA